MNMDLDCVNRDEKTAALSYDESSFYFLGPENTDLGFIRHQGHDFSLIS